MPLRREKERKEESVDEERLSRLRLPDFATELGVSGREVLTLEGHSAAVFGVAVSPDGRYAVSLLRTVPSRCGSWTDE